MGLEKLATLYLYENYFISDLSLIKLTNLTSLFIYCFCDKGKDLAITNNSITRLTNLTLLSLPI